MRNLLLMGCVLLIGVIYGYTVPFSPKTSGSVTPRLCGNCKEALTEDGVMKCRLFGRTNVVSGKTDHFACSVCREDPHKCGANGTFFFHYLEVVSKLE